jgi:hypothetical protein
VVVNNSNIEGIFAVPIKAKTPLVVDADTVLPVAVVGKPFKAIPSGNAQVLNAREGIQRKQSDMNTTQDFCRKA